MTSNSKVLIFLAVFLGLCGICGLISLAFYIPNRDNVIRKEAAQTALAELPPSAVEIQTVLPDLPIEAKKIAFNTVVLISALYEENGQYEEGWTGSGTIVSPDGLILTNAHVVLPDKYFRVDALAIAPTLNQDEKPEPRYFAKVLQADTKLDLAVLKITTDLAGNPVNSSGLNLPFVELGNSDDLNLGDRLTILGYPGIGGDTITLTSGEVAGFTSEADYGSRAFIKTSATISGGNSGGLAEDDAGKMVGIPTLLGSGGEAGIVDCRTLADTNRDGVIDENDNCVPTGGFINSLRPVNLAIPLIEAAKRGEERIVAENIPEEVSTPSDGTLLYQDDFSNPASGWTVQSDSDGFVGYVNGEYQISVTTPMLFISEPSEFAAGDVILDVNTRVIDSTGDGDYGLICRQQEDGSYYGLEVSEDGYASIWKNINDEILPLVEWEYFEGLEGQQELLITAACVGDRLELGVNGQVLISATDSDLQSGYAGLIAGTWESSGLTIGFDNFTVRSPGN